MRLSGTIRNPGYRPNTCMQAIGHCVSLSVSRWLCVSVTGCLCVSVSQCFSHHHDHYYFAEACWFNVLKVYSFLSRLSVFMAYSVVSFADSCMAEIERELRECQGHSPFTRWTPSCLRTRLMKVRAISHKPQAKGYQPQAKGTRPHHSKQLKELTRRNTRLRREVRAMWREIKELRSGNKFMNIIGKDLLFTSRKLTADITNEFQRQLELLNDRMKHQAQAHRDRVTIDKLRKELTEKEQDCHYVVSVRLRQQ